LNGNLKFDFFDRKFTILITPKRPIDLQSPEMMTWTFQSDEGDFVQNLVRLSVALLVSTLEALAVD